MKTLISKNARDLIDEWLKKFPKDRKQSAVIYALRLVQDENKGWLSTELLDAVADYLEIPNIAVYEVATFYSMFELNPVGQHKIEVCTNVSCQLMGCDEIVTHLKDRLKIGFGETTEDGMFTLKEVECLAACQWAPVIQMGKCMHKCVTRQQLDSILDEMAE